jgi:hypothetical protein
MSGRFFSFDRDQEIIISSSTFANFLRSKCYPFAWTTGDVKNCKFLSPSSWHLPNCMRLLYSMTSREDRKCSRILGQFFPLTSQQHSGIPAGPEISSTTRASSSYHLFPYCLSHLSVISFLLLSVLFSLEFLEEWSHNKIHMLHPLWDPLLYIDYPSIIYI